MKKVFSMIKKAIEWYSSKHAECYSDRYQRYAYRFY